MPPAYPLALPHLETSDVTLDRAFRIALGDLASNIVPFQDGLLDAPAPVLLAGLGYDAPWTRDAAINTWNGAGLLCPTVARDTLLSVLARRDGAVVIGGQYDQYWDAIIWALGAWALYLYTGDRAFLALAFDATRRTLARLEVTERDPATGLFRGPAVYGDGVSAYPDAYAQTAGSASILDWPAANPDLVAPTGRGLPMYALSTNCLYHAVYGVLDDMAVVLGAPRGPAWRERASALRHAIHAHFWDAVAGHYRYLVGPLGASDHQEGLGHAFALLFDVASPAEATSVLRTQHITPAGIPCVWPPFARYASAGGTRFGRHCGTVWPHIQGFWAEAAARHGDVDAFAFELRQLAGKACRDAQFAELYHPLTGAIYGGTQERAGMPLAGWDALPRQTWSATGYLRAVLMGLCGLRFEPAGVRFAPLVPPGIAGVVLRRLPYREMTLDLAIAGTGTHVAVCAIDGAAVDEPFVPAAGSGPHRIEITMSSAESAPDRG